MKISQQVVMARIIVESGLDEYLKSFHIVFLSYLSLAVQSRKSRHLKRFTGDARVACDADQPSLITPELFEKEGTVPPAGKWEQTRGAGGTRAKRGIQHSCVMFSSTV